MLACDNHPSWNKGYTKATHSSIARQSATLAERMKDGLVRRPRGIHTQMPLGFQFGRVVTETTRQKITVGMKAYISEHGMKHPRFPTNLEYALLLLLEDAGLGFEAQVQFGLRFADFYIPSHNLVFEADGSYWHRNLEAEAKRDEELLKSGVAAVIHLNEDDLDPWIDDWRTDRKRN